MKGIMVTLLMFLTTGIVVGQQGNSSNNSFSTAASSAQNDLLKPLEIGVSADAIRAIRDGKVLVSKIEPIDPDSGKKLNPNVISGVSLYQEGNILKTLPKATVRGRDDGDGVLRFSLTDADLRALQNSQLKMDFGFSQRGKFQEIEVSYAGSNQNGANAQQPRPNTNNGFTPTRATRPQNPTPEQRGSSRSQFAFGPRGNQNNQPRQTPFIPLPAPAEPGEINFMGPALPSPAAGNWTPPTRTTQNNPAFDPNRQRELANNRNTGQWNMPKPNNPQDAIDAMKAKWDAERRQLEHENELRRQNADRLKKEEAAHELAKWQWEQEQLRKQQSHTPLAPVLNGPQLTADQLAYQKMLWELDQREKQLYSMEETLRRKSDLLDAKTRQQAFTGPLANPLNNPLNNPLSNLYVNQTLRTNPAQNVNPDWERSNGITPGTHFYPEDFNGPVTERARTPISPIDHARRNVGYPDSGFRPASSNKDIAPRVATNPANPKRGIDNYIASVAGPGSRGNSTGATRGTSELDHRNDRVHGFVLFLLLCSLGLNFYLAFISRGFYVRYHELADELRETFSTTH